jgi:hypothetical protein
VPARGEAAKLDSASVAHLVRRARGGVEPNLDGLSLGSLLGLVRSYPYGEVPPAVVHAVESKAQELSCDPDSVAEKLVRLCLESRGYHGA